MARLDPPPLTTTRPKFQEIYDIESGNVSKVYLGQEINPPDAEAIFGSRLHELLACHPDFASEFIPKSAIGTIQKSIPDIILVCVKRMLDDLAFAKAAIADLRAESSAYQRGHKEGVDKAISELSKWLVRSTPRTSWGTSPTSLGEFLGELTTKNANGEILP